MRLDVVVGGDQWWYTVANTTVDEYIPLWNGMRNDFQ
jgi:hypothetical protein